MCANCIITRTCACQWTRVHGCMLFTDLSLSLLILSRCSSALQFRPKERNFPVAVPCKFRLKSCCWRFAVPLWRYGKCQNFNFISQSRVTGLPRLHRPGYIRRCDLVPFCNSVLKIDAAPVLPQSLFVGRTLATAGSCFRFR